MGLVRSAKVRDSRERKAPHRGGRLILYLFLLIHRRIMEEMGLTF